MTAKATIHIAIDGCDTPTLMNALDLWLASTFLDDLTTAIRAEAPVLIVEDGERLEIDVSIREPGPEIDVSRVLPHELAKALDAEVRALGDDYTGQWLRVRYEHCGMSWEDVWPCSCDSECPVCGQDIEATSWEDVDTDTGNPWNQGDPRED